MSSGLGPHEFASDVSTVVPHDSAVSGSDAIGNGPGSSDGSSLEDVPSLGASVGFIPSLPIPIPLQATADARDDPLALQPGQGIDDYHVIAILGRGAFGAVYLAWQNSLGRQIALKISPCIGEEGRNLARLDHPHIVRVYSEKRHNGMRLLCMQYVPSAALDDLLKKLRPDAGAWTGKDLLAQIDQSHVISTELDPEQLADRQRLSELGHADAVCWIIGRLAEALAHAHRHNVLHRDLKPGNVLISQYGRPMLVDFNLANVVQEHADDSQVFGGTLPYMSPEHLDAYNAADPTPPSAVTRQSDVYSLGVMLYELLTGRLPFPSAKDGTPPGEWLHRLAAERRRPEAIWSAPELLAEPAIRSVLQRTLAPDPGARWASADELSRALFETIELRQTCRVVARTSRMPAWFYRHPFVMLAILGIAPHILGSLFNIPYNLLRIVGPDRQPVFFQLVNVYNVLVYPGCVAICGMVVVPIFKLWRRRDVAPPEELNAARRHVLTFPKRAAQVALLGWIPGAAFFPLGLHLHPQTGPLTWDEVLHLQLSVALSGLIALTYSMLGVLALTTCVFYPALWIDPHGFRQNAAREVRGLTTLVRLIPLLAGAIPLVGALLLISSIENPGVGGHAGASQAEFRTFQLLTIGLIVLGMTGFQTSVSVTNIAARAIDAFLGRRTDDCPP